MKVLLIEDEEYLSAAICKMLKAENMIADPVYDGEEGLDYAYDELYDAIILDVMLPGMDGFEILKEIRKDGIKTPVLMLTARAELEDRLTGLESGADYYLTKPFEKEELIACLHVITRRKKEAVIQKISFGDLFLSDKDTKLVCSRQNTDIRLSTKEYQLMEFFLMNPGRLLSKELIEDRVWGIDSETEYNCLEVYISFLRKKLSFLKSNVIIKNTRGIGYSLEIAL